MLAHVELTNAVRRHDTPWVHQTTPARDEGMLRHGWDGEPDVPYLVTEDGSAVAVGFYGTSMHDNHHLAWLDLEVHPERRGRGVGSAVLAHLLAIAVDEGKTSVGLSCWDTPHGFDGFALRHGFERKAVGVNRRQYLAEVDSAVVAALHDQALAAASDYELLRTQGRSDDAELEGLAVLTAAINDAPKEGLEVDDQVFSAERIRAYEVAQTARGNVLHRVVARHRETGELAGQTLVAVEGEHPAYAEQHDTSVLAAHRGHRLGALLKTEMLLWLADTQPQVTEIDTWNAESNSFMIGVNEVLGYRVVGRGFDFQRSL
ncbi:hypothetical protein BH11ACT8_BH11ACT8_17910 [soil metagenome]